MLSHNPVYPLPQGAFPIHINSELTTLLSASLIPEWKLGWIGEKVLYGGII